VKTVFCKNDTLFPNFKIGKMYMYNMCNDNYYIIDEYSIVWRFDKKWQNKFQDFFNFKTKYILFDSMFYEIKELRRLKLEKLNGFNI